MTAGPDRELSGRTPGLAEHRLGARAFWVQRTSRAQSRLKPEALGRLRHLRGLCLPWTGGPKLQETTPAALSPHIHKSGDNPSASETEGHFPHQPRQVSLRHLRHRSHGKSLQLQPTTTWQCVPESPPVTLTTTAPTSGERWPALPRPL